VVQLVVQETHEGSSVFGNRVGADAGRTAAVGIEHALDVGIREPAGVRLSAHPVRGRELVSDDGGVIQELVVRMVGW
jgi:hypothetical protein